MPSPFKKTELHELLQRGAVWRAEESAAVCEGSSNISKSTRGLLDCKELPSTALVSDSAFTGCTASADRALSTDRLGFAEDGTFTHPAVSVECVSLVEPVSSASLDPIRVFSPPGHSKPLHASSTNSPRPTAVPFNVPEIDNDLPFHGLRIAALHEWQIDQGKVATPAMGLPTTIPSMLALQAMVRSHDLQIAPTHESSTRATADAHNDLPCIIWIGRRSWPSPYLIAATFPKEVASAILKKCLFIDPPNARLHLWSLETALRSPAAAAVISEVPARYTFTVSQRLALASRAGGGLGLLLTPRPIPFVSAATSRWFMRTVPSKTPSPRWQLELLRHKGGSPRTTSWIVELAQGSPHEPLSLRVPADVVDRSRAERSAGSGETPTVAARA